MSEDADDTTTATTVRQTCAETEEWSSIEASRRSEEFNWNVLKRNNVSGMATQPEQIWSDRLAQMSTVMRGAVLTSLFVGYLAIVGALGYGFRGAEGLTAAVLATAVCLVADWIALVVAALIAPPENAGAHVLSGMLIRMSLPLFVTLFVMQKLPNLIDAGFPWFVVGAFSLGLLLETLFSVAQLKQSTTHAGGHSAPNRTIPPQSSNGCAPSRPTPGNEV